MVNIVVLMQSRKCRAQLLLYQPTIMEINILETVSKLFYKQRMEIDTLFTQHSVLNEGDLTSECTILCRTVVFDNAKRSFALTYFVLWSEI